MGMGMGMRMGMGMGMIDEMINSVVWGVKTLLQDLPFVNGGAENIERFEIINLIAAKTLVSTVLTWERETHCVELECFEVEMSQ